MNRQIFINRTNANDMTAISFNCMLCEGCFQYRSIEAKEILKLFLAGIF